jgi:hypothetical protein
LVSGTCKISWTGVPKMIGKFKKITTVERRKKIPQSQVHNLGNQPVLNFDPYCKKVEAL